MKNPGLVISRNDSTSSTTTKQRVNQYQSTTDYSRMIYKQLTHLQIYSLTVLNLRLRGRGLKVTSQITSVHFMSTNYRRLSSFTRNPDTEFKDPGGKRTQTGSRNTDPQKKGSPRYTLLYFLQSLCVFSISVL